MSSLSYNNSLQKGDATGEGGENIRSSKSCLSFLCPEKEEKSEKNRLELYYIFTLAWPRLLLPLLVPNKCRQAAETSKLSRSSSKHFCLKLLLASFCVSAKLLTAGKSDSQQLKVQRFANLRACNLVLGPDRVRHLGRK